MKILTVLSLFQIATITVLFFKFTALEADMNSQAPTTSGVPIRESHTSPPALTVGPSGISLTPANIEQLRSMVREELATALQFVGPREQSAQRMPTTPEQQTDNQRPDSEYDYAREVVQNEIGYFVSRGAISENEMAGLQSQIGKLGQEGREEMLRELVKALNSGELKGHL